MMNAILNLNQQKDVLDPKVLTNTDYVIFQGHERYMHRFVRPKARRF